MKRKYTLKAMLCMSLILIFYNPLFSQQLLWQKVIPEGFQADMRGGKKTDLNDEIKKFIYSTTQMDVIIYVVNQAYNVKRKDIFSHVGPKVYIYYYFINKTNSIIKIQTFTMIFKCTDQIIISPKVGDEIDITRIPELYTNYASSSNENFPIQNGDKKFEYASSIDQNLLPAFYKELDDYNVNSVQITNLQVKVLGDLSNNKSSNNFNKMNSFSPKQNNSNASQDQNNQNADSVNQALYQASAQMLTGLLSNAKFNNDKVVNKKTFFKMKVAFGNCNIPYYENTTTDVGSYSNSTNLNAYYAEVALPFYVYKDKSFYFLLEPYFTIRVFGTASKYTEYGGTGRLSFGKKLSFFAEGQLNYKEGNYISNITSNYNGSKINTEGTFGYNPIRFGGGIRIPFTKIDSPQDAYLELSYFRELLGTFTSNIDQQSNPGLSSYPADKADIFKLNILFGGGVFVEGEYSPKYPTVGDANFKIQEPVKISGNYYSIKAGLMFNL